MSVINKMLQDLDRRQARPGADGAQAPPAASARRGGREWFWRTLAVLILIALGWVAWVAYQIWPRPVATELAYRVADQARAARARAAAEQPPTPPQPEPPVVQSAATEPATPPQPESPTPPETFRLAQSIETPIVEPPPQRLARPAPTARKDDPPKAKKAPPKEERPKAEHPKVERRDRPSTPAQLAENEFRYAAAVLKRGHATQAEVHFTRALELDPRHHGARQALAAMHIERGELEPARRLLEEGLRLDPGQADFAVALARILVERKDLPDALKVLDDAAAAGGGTADVHLLRGTVLQRLARHEEAAGAYRAALEGQGANAQAWLGLGVSLDALQRRPEAADAFRRALAAGPLPAEVRSYAEQRIRALR